MRFENLPIYSNSFKSSNIFYCFCMFVNKIYGYINITWEFVGLRVQNFQDFIFIWKQTYRKIFKSAVVYLLMYNVDILRCKTYLIWIDNSYVIFIFLSQCTFNVQCRKIKMQNIHQMNWQLLYLFFFLSSQCSVFLL